MYEELESSSEHSRLSTQDSALSTSVGSSDETTFFNPSSRRGGGCGRDSSRPASQKRPSRSPRSWQRVYPADKGRPRWTARTWLHPREKPCLGYSGEGQLRRTP